MRQPGRQIVILAGGLGTRLRDRLGELPKPLAPVAGRPVLEHQIELAARHGFDDVRLLTGHGAAIIEARIGSGERFGVRIRYHEEDAPLGTAGAVLQVLDELDERFVVLYADTLLDVDLARMVRSHTDRAADATLFVHPNDHPHDSDLVETDDEDWIRAFHGHPHPPDAWLPNLVNAALYVVERAALAPWSPPAGKLDFARDLFPRMLAAGRRLHGYRSREYIKDLGTPERLARVEADVASGRVRRLSLRGPCPAVFLDRDGTLNEEVNRVASAEQLVLLEGVGPAVRRINAQGLLAVVITNQPVIARGDTSEAELRRIHAKLDTLLGREGAYLDALYHCPHHPDRGFAGERPELKIACACRKPGTALIDRAVAELRIDRAGSWMVGDSTVDLATARNAGLRAVLVRTGHAGADGRFAARANYEFFDLGEAVDFITRRHAGLLDRARHLLPALAPGSIVCVGGLSRAGKTTWAALLAEALAERGRRTHVLPLDAWLRGADERPGGDVRTRFDVARIRETVARLARRTKPLTLTIGAYDRMRRRHLETGETLAIAADDCILFEGVLGLDLEFLREAAAARFYVDCPEPVRRRRFEREYALRGHSAERIARLYDEREGDEHGIVRASAAFADVTIESGDDDHQ